MLGLEGLPSAWRSPITRIIGDLGERQSRYCSQADLLVLRTAV